MQWLQVLVDGLLLGSIYALIALGYTMVYGVLRFINFAHGEIFMAGAYGGMLIAPLALRLCGGSPGWAPALLTIAGAMALAAVLGVLIEFLAYRPLRSRPRITALITAIGVSFFLQNLAQVLFGGAPRSFPQVLPEVQWVLLGKVTVALGKAVALLLAPLLLGGLCFLVLRTRLGLAMRALAFNPQAAPLMGVNPDRVVSATFAIGSGLAGAGGVLWCLAYPQLTPVMGVKPGLSAFVAAVLGGIGSLPGAALGALLLGLSEQAIAASPWSAWRDALVFGILVLILLVRPTGLLGRGDKEKV